MIGPRLAAILVAAALAAPASAFDLQGHRGARGLAPENTLAAFAKALAIGVTTLETDLAITRDGVVVISHDPDLNPALVRDGGTWLPGRGPAIRSLTLAELARYDVGRVDPASRYGQQWPEQVARDGERIPTLADVFALVERLDKPVRFNLETKLTPTSGDAAPDAQTFARLVLDAVRKAGATARTTIQSFDWRTLAIVQKEAPEIATAYLSSQQQTLDNIQAGHREDSPWTAGIRFRDHGSVPKMVKAAGGKIWSPNVVDVTEALVKEAKSLGLTVLPWTVNERAEMERLIDWGVDGLISDYPDRLREVMAAKNLPLPRATPVTP